MREDNFFRTDSTSWPAPQLSYWPRQSLTWKFSAPGSAGVGRFQKGPLLKNQFRVSSLSGRPIGELGATSRALELVTRGPAPPLRGRGNLRAPSPAGPLRCEGLVCARGTGSGRRRSRNRAWAAEGTGARQGLEREERPPPLCFFDFSGAQQLGALGCRTE